MAELEAMKALVAQLQTNQHAVGDKTSPDADRGMPRSRLCFSIC